MVNEWLLLNGLKTVLDADATLSALLQVVEAGESKVLLGPSRPVTAQSPYLQLYVSSHTADEEAKWDTVEVSFVIYASDKSGLADLEQIANIADRLAVLVDETPPTLAGHTKYNIGLTGFTTTVPTPLSTDGTAQHYQEVRFNFRGIKT